jgi:hypothetical protein
MQTIGEMAMPTPKEYRLRAYECLELMKEPNEWYVKKALLELAQEFRMRAAKMEHTQTAAGQGVIACS